MGWSLTKKKFKEEKSKSEISQRKEQGKTTLHQVARAGSEKKKNTRKLAHMNK